MLIKNKRKNVEYHILCPLFWTKLFIYHLAFFDFVSAVKSQGHQQQHTNNWAILVSTSRYWFNYRHEANTLSIYHTVKRLGIPDSQIILMLADDMPCNARNTYPGEIYNNKDLNINLYGEEVEVDYRDSEVTVENFLRLLTGRTLPWLPPSKQLNSDEHSNILIFMSGHGGDEFLKFQDQEEISSQDIADAFEEMQIKGRYNEILFMIDTCQAGTLANDISSTGVLSIGSSKLGENSYSHHGAHDIGVAVIDRFTHTTLDFFERSFVGGNDHRQGSATADHFVSLEELFRSYNPRTLKSNVDIRDKYFERNLKEVPVTDFFGSTLDIDLTDDIYPLEL